MCRFTTFTESNDVKYEAFIQFQVQIMRFNFNFNRKDKLRHDSFVGQKHLKEIN